MTPAREAVCVGECMVELSRQPDGAFRLAFGGDTFNTAVYLSRSGIGTSYTTALGDDSYSTGILDLARAEGLATDTIEIRPSRVPGLYMIETDARGERSFTYWRENSPARELFDAPSAHLLQTLQTARLIYLSGITLWLYGDRGRANLFGALDAARERGVTVAFDSNFRPKLWRDREGARAAFEAMLSRTDIALPTFDDERDLWGDRDVTATLARCQLLGIAETVVKMGPAGATVRCGGETLNVPAPARTVPVDTTGAGDSFNAGYLATRLFGLPPGDAALAGHRLASAIIAHPGGVVPVDATRGALPIRPWEDASGPTLRAP